MSDNEYEKRCSEYNGEVHGFYFILTMFVFGLVFLTASTAAYLGMTDWWLIEIAGGFLFISACCMDKEIFLDRLLMFWSCEDE